MLSELNKPEVKIITVEDPVEYRLARITQVQVHSSINLSFSVILRSILRQDPDIIMIGELRDQETAEIALRSAMTGHFVFSTLHTNDAISSAERLIDMGVESYLVAAVLKAVIAQRLVRRICPNCIENHILSPQEESWLASIEKSSSGKLSFKQGKGCSYCYQTGYKGQVGIFEFLLLNRELLEAIRLKHTAEFRQIANQSPGFQSLVRNGLHLVAQGVTTLEEVMQVTGEISSEI
jgi:MSHA biogenesis protein MshE